MRVRWTLPALAQLEEIQDHIAEDSPVAAFRLASALVSRADRLLSANPLAGRVGRARDTRELVLVRMPYIVVYRIAQEDVEILAVIHAARDWPEASD